VQDCAPPQGDLILQMDIEGAEWSVLLNASEAILDRFRIVVLELHYLEHMRDRVSHEVMTAVFERLCCGSSI